MWLQRETLNSHAINVARHVNVYICGDHDETIYSIVSGHIKLLAVSPEGKQCLLSIYSDGDIFGEFALSGIGGRRETATAMAETVVTNPAQPVFSGFSRDALLEGFVHYLAMRIADQQRVIANLVMVDSEQRLAQTLLQLAPITGQHDSRSIRIVPRISHAELAEMVGTTRPRISTFMKRFRDLG